MSATDRLARSAGKLVDVAGDAVTVNGRPLRGLFRETTVPADAWAGDMVRAVPKRTAELELRPVDADGVATSSGEALADGVVWTITPGTIRRGGWLVLFLEQA